MEGAFIIQIMPATITSRQYSQKLDTHICSTLLRLGKYLYSKYFTCLVTPSLSWAPRLTSLPYSHTIPTWNWAQKWRAGWWDLEDKKYTNTHINYSIKAKNTFFCNYEAVYQNSDSGWLKTHCYISGCCRKMCPTFLMHRTSPAQKNSADYLFLLPPIMPRGCCMPGWLSCLLGFSPSQLM